MMRRMRFLAMALFGAAACMTVPASAASDYLVASYGSDQILRYASDGSFVGVFAGVTHPSTIHGDSAGNVYVGSYLGNGSSQLLRYNSAGSLTKTYTSSSGWIGGVIVDASGTVYATDNQNNRVMWFAPDNTSGNLSPGAQSINTPMGMALDSQDRLYVATDGHVLRWDASRSNVINIVDNPRLNSVAIVNPGGNEGIWAARSDGQTVGYVLGWDINGSWTGPYVETQGVPQWLNTMYIPDTSNPSNFLLVGSTGIISYDISNLTKSTLIAIGSGGLSSPYGITQLVPEPASLLVLAGGLMGLAGMIRKRRA
ncbi:MAG: PEP-CTERM sorting domain-containing protein [Armatimonadetes bacterium]|nr:PEP-CTERM sorting domain-containing protein [Armatimonadota bacterium]